MPRPRERTWLFGFIPYHETPSVCQDCGKITAWPPEPEMVGRFSEEPEVVAKFDEYRGEPREGTMKPARRGNREGGMVQQDLPGIQAVRGAMCEECEATMYAELATLTGKGNKLAAILQRRKTEQQTEPSLAERLDKDTVSEADAMAFFGKKPEDKEG